MTNNTKQSDMEPVDVVAELEAAADTLDRFGYQVLVDAVESLRQRAERIRSMPALSDEMIVKAVHAVRGAGRIALTCINNDGIEVPTDVARCFVREVSATSNAPALQPISTKERPPTAEDGEYVWARLPHSESYAEEHFSHVARWPDTYTYWLPLNALPVPKDET